MSKYCIKCGKKIGLFTTYTCKNCGKKFCYNCINSIIDYEQKYSYKHKYEELNLDFPNFNYSFIKSSYIACSECINNFRIINDKIDYAFDNANNVKTYSINYKGKIKTDGRILKLSTYYYRDKMYAQHILQAKAAYYGYNLIYNMNYERTTDEEPSNNGKGVYLFSVFSYTGIASNLYKK